MIRKRTPAQMRRLVMRCRASGESGAQFARRHHVSPWTFWYWCRKLADEQPREAARQPTPPTFVVILSLHLQRTPSEALALYRRLEQFGLLVILALVFFVPQLQVPLSAAIFGLVTLITTPFGVTADVEPLLRTLLFG
jgi:transposase-like protein